MNIYEIKSIEKLIKGNEYVGRGIIAGRSKDGKNAVCAYFIMGRSENSRNRIFEKEGDSLKTEPFDPSKVSDPSLIIYNAVRPFKKSLIVTNGDQTDTIFDLMSEGKSFSAALETRAFEPDAPNFTPRISALLNLEHGFSYEMSILKSLDEDGSDCCRFTFSYPSKPGLGHFIHTYVQNGEPIPTFQGEPERTLIPDDIDEFTSEIWKNLDESNKISLYVRYTDIESGKYTDRLLNKNN